MHPILAEVTRDQLKKHVPDFRAGDSLRVAVRIVEGDKERTQRFEGVCIARHGVGMDETFTVRRVSYGVGMERIFPLHSPRVESITVLRHGHVRRAKLYYLRDLTGKKARLSETKRKRLAKGHLLEVALPALAAAKEPEEAVAAVTPEETADEQTTEAAATEEAAQAKGADEAQAEAETTGSETAEKAAEEKTAEDKPADAKPEA